MERRGGREGRFREAKGGMRGGGRWKEKTVKEGDGRKKETRRGKGGGGREGREVEERGRRWSEGRDEYIRIEGEQ